MLFAVVTFQRREDDTDCGAIFADVLNHLRVPRKEAAARCLVSEDAIDKLISGERPFDLRWVQRMGWAFLSEFVVRFLYSRQRAFVAEMGADLQRVSKSEQQKRSA